MRAPLTLLLIATCFGAVIRGTVYDWSTLEPAYGAIVTVNSTPEQQFVAVHGYYNFFLPPGKYVIRAEYFNDSRLVATAEENITVSGEGEYMLDLLLFPSIGIEELNETEIEIELNESELVAEKPWSVFGILTALIIALAALTVWAASRAVKKPKPLDPDAKKVYEIIKREKRITQKELRRRLPWSEAKVSLILTDLEAQGLIKKIKKGRGNIIKVI